MYAVNTINVPHEFHEHNLVFTHWKPPDPSLGLSPWLSETSLIAGRDEAWVRDWVTQMILIQFSRVGLAVKENQVVSSADKGRGMSSDFS